MSKVFPLTQSAKREYFSILLVTGCSGHLRSTLTKMALISPSTACPSLLKHSQTPHSGWRDPRGETEGARDGAAGRGRLSFYTASLSLMRGPAGRPFSHLQHFHSDYLGPRALTEIQRQSERVDSEPEGLTTAIQNNIQSFKKTYCSERELKAYFCS